MNRVLAVGVHPRLGRFRAMAGRKPEKRIISRQSVSSSVSPTVCIYECMRVCASICAFYSIGYASCIYVHTNKRYGTKEKISQMFTMHCHSNNLEGF